MSNMQQSLNAGQTKGQTQARTEEWMEATKSTTNEGRERELNSSNSNSAQLQPHQQSNSPHQQQGKEEAAGFLQQTGEKMVNMAQGAVDTVKDTLGMGDKK